MKGWQVVVVTVVGFVAVFTLGFMVNQVSGLVDDNERAGGTYITRAWGYTDTQDKEVLFFWDKGKGSISNKELYTPIVGLRNQVNEMQRDLETINNRARNDTASIMSTQKEIIDRLSRIESVLFGK